MRGKSVVVVRKKDVSSSESATSKSTPRPRPYYNARDIRVTSPAYHAARSRRTRIVERIQNSEDKHRNTNTTTT